MATLEEISSLIGAGALHTKFLAARLQNAWNVLAESALPEDPRHVWAVKIFANYNADEGKEYRWFLSHESVQAVGDAITDEDCILAVASFIDVWAAPEAAA